MIKKLSIDLIVDDMGKSLDFYVNLLGLEKIESYENFARLRVGESELMLMVKEDFNKEMPELNCLKNEGLSVLIIETDEIEKIYNLVKDQVKMLRELTSTDYGTKEFDFEDPDGYIVQFTERK